jgi:ABC-2 type transport system permease protein
MFFVTHILLIKMLFVVGGADQIAGFSIHQIYLVVALAQIAIFFVYVFIQSNTPLVINQINNGLLDFFLVKPASAKFLIMTQRFVAVQAYIIILYLMVFFPYLYYMGALDLTWQQFGWLLYITINSILIHGLLLWIAAGLNFIWPNFRVLYLFINNTLNVTDYPKKIYPQVIQGFLTFIVPLFLIINPAYEVLEGSFGWDDFVNIFLITLMFGLIFLNLFKYGLKRYNSAA